MERCRRQLLHIVENVNVEVNCNIIMNVLLHSNMESLLISLQKFTKYVYLHLTC